MQVTKDATNTEEISHPFWLNAQVEALCNHHWQPWSVSRVHLERYQSNTAVQAVLVIKHSHAAGVEIQYGTFYTGSPASMASPS
jgi:hypothetical protein